MARPKASAALADLMVLDLTRVRAGPTCARQLADWGADVIKVEIPEAAGGGGDFSTRHDSDFQNLHRNKRSISLNLKAKEAVEILKRLVAKADVLIENYRPGVTDRLGLDYKTLSAINPRMVYCSISGFGQDGPYRDRPGVDQIAQGMSGLMSITGAPGGGPMRAGIALADMSAGIFGSYGIMVALHERERSGKGQWVQTSLLQSQIFLLDFQASRYLVKGEVPEQVGNNHPTGAPTGCFRTSDGYANIAMTPVMWPRFCKAFQRDDLFDHPDYFSPKARLAHRDALNAIIEEMTVKMTTDELVDLLNEGGIPCGPIYDVAQMFADPQVQHNGTSGKVTSAKLGEMALLTQPVTLSRTPSRLDAASPECGEHNAEILAELGYGAADIAAFQKAGAL